MLNKSCELMDSNSAPLALKAAAIQTFPQLLPERNEGLVVLGVWLSNRANTITTVNHGKFKSRCMRPVRPEKNRQMSIKVA